MSYSQILYEVEDRILTLTLNRPDRLNAFTQTMLEELVDALDRSDADDQIRAVIVTGAGRGFCAGADLESGGGTFDPSKRKDRGPAQILRRDGGGLLTLRLYESRKPVIAAINGPAVGVGATMTLPMDIRLASEDARLGFVFCRRGLVPEACSSWFLPRLVGMQQAAEWVYSGRVFPASEALAGGVGRSLRAPDELLPAAREIAREIADHSAPVSVALSRHMLWKMLGAEHPMDAHRVDSRGIYVLGQSADAREGVQSFLEKRPPKFGLSPSEDMPDFFPWWDEPNFR